VEGVAIGSTAAWPVVEREFAASVTLAASRAGQLAFVRDLVARGLSGVALVTNDAHNGLVAAIGVTFPGASWQRMAAGHLEK
jgi:hypothetical protein